MLSLRAPGSAARGLGLRPGNLDRQHATGSQETIGALTQLSATPRRCFCSHLPQRNFLCPSRPVDLVLCLVSRLYQKGNEPRSDVAMERTPPSSLPAGTHDPGQHRQGELATGGLRPAHEVVADSAEQVGARLVVDD